MNEELYNLSKRQQKTYPVTVYYADGTSDTINVDSLSKENFTKSKKNGLLFCTNFHGTRLAINYDKILKLEY